ncbi:hypothetical protein Tco_0894316 [Tanacetum coccineum]|uniref:Reverse transcriptase n=1 Tax=Tanacetum coccineum TaxID=301880 RepID=A0ABQ5CCP7_9ASTR
MNDIFKPYLRKFTLVFFDDILVYNPSLDSHAVHLRMISPEKGVDTGLAKVTAMQNWPSLRNLKQLRGFLGLAGYYRIFIRDYAAIGQPLTAPLKNNA